MLRTMAGAPRLAGVSDESLRMREQQMLVRLARHFHVDESVLRARLRELRQPARRTRHTALATPAGGSAPGLMPWEEELLEILLSHPQLVPEALEAVDAGQFSTPIAREIWELYRQARQEGAGCDADQILTIAENVELKSRVVHLHDQACRKAPLASQDASQRLRGIVGDLERRRQLAAQRHVLATLDKREYDEKEELAVLQTLIEQERKRQGISAPTDG
jgi:hypothetical protein